MHSLWRSLLDVFYPPRCQVCRDFSAQALCGECIDESVLIEPPICRICGGPLDPSAKGPVECYSCRMRKRSYITWSRAAGIYVGPLQSAILQLKFNGHRTLAKPLADLLVSLEEKALVEETLFDVVCPVPLHPERLSERGFNQSELLAKYFCEKTGLPLDCSILERTRHTIPQVMLPAVKRKGNVRGAFSLAEEADVRKKRIILIDDVYTTGATLQECARVLRQAGVAEVYVLTVALPKPKWMVTESE